MAKDNLKVKVVSADNRTPIAFVDLSVEYADTIINYKGNRKGKLSFTPSSFPLTVTAHATGMESATFGLMSMPSKTMTIELEPDPSTRTADPKRRVHWSTATPRRLRSSYIVRTPKK